MAQKYIKVKPIEAVQYSDKTMEEFENFVDQNVLVRKEGELYIHTMEGDMLVKKGSFVIKGAHGEFYACDEEIFMETYRPYDQETK